VAFVHLRKMALQFRDEARSVENDFRVGECVARTTLAYFGEEPPVGGALPALQTFLEQVSSFSADFKSALKKIREVHGKKVASGKARPKAKGTASPRRGSAKAQSAVRRRALQLEGVKTDAPALPSDPAPANASTNADLIINTVEQDPTCSNISENRDQAIVTTEGTPPDAVPVISTRSSSACAVGDAKALGNDEPRMEEDRSRQHEDEDEEDEDS